MHAWVGAWWVRGTADAASRRAGNVQALVGDPPSPCAAPSPSLPLPPGGDCVLTACLWHQGFAYTDPGFELAHRATHRSGMFLFNGARSDWRLVRRGRGGSRGACCVR